MKRPRPLDEPSLGLASRVVRLIFGDQEYMARRWHARRRYVLVNAAITMVGKGRRRHTAENPGRLFDVAMDEKVVSEDH